MAASSWLAAGPVRALRKSCGLGLGRSPLLSAAVLRLLPAVDCESLSGHPSSCCYDTFVASGYQLASNTAHMCIHMLFGLLEWKHDQVQEGAKEHRFRECDCFGCAD